MAYRQNNSQGRNDPIRFDLMERIGVLSRKDNGWTREVNIVAWNDGPGKVDIREWDPDHKRMTRGVTLFEDEAERLTKVLARRYGLRLTDRVSRSFAEPVGVMPEGTAESRMESAYDTSAAGAAEDHAESAYDTTAVEAAENHAELAYDTMDVAAAGAEVAEVADGSGSDAEMADGAAAGNEAAEAADGSAEDPYGANLL